VVVGPIGGSNIAARCFCFVSALRRWPVAAAAQQKIPQVEAEYQDQPKGRLACSACTLFSPGSILRDRAGRRRPSWPVPSCSICRTERPSERFKELGRASRHLAPLRERSGACARIPGEGREALSVAAKSRAPPSPQRPPPSPTLSRWRRREGGASAGRGERCGSDTAPGAAASSGPQPFRCLSKNATASDHSSKAGPSR
jgi:hypothetical protein